jgi:hypothetical protein
MNIHHIGCMEDCYVPLRQHRNINVLARIIRHSLKVTQPTSMSQITSIRISEENDLCAFYFSDLSWRCSIMMF